MDSFLLIVMSSTRNRSIATSWRKNSMMSAICWVFPEWNWSLVVVLQILGVDSLMCSQRIVEVRTISQRSDFSRFIERNPPILSISKVLFLRHSKGAIFLRVLVHLDTDFFSSIMFELRIHEIRDLSRNDRESLQNSS